jgi:chemotaxis protein MotB
MRNRRKHEESHENHERWLVSYADFITLMFAFFVVMFATSQADRAKTKAVADAVSKALQEDKFTAQVMNVVNKKADHNKAKSSIDLTSVTVTQPNQQKHVELTPSLKQLTAELQEDIKAGRLQIELVPRGLVISLKEGAFFSPGHADVNEERYGSVAKLARVIQRLPNPVRLEGHTDSQPISNSRFRSNWELSAARSIAVLELLRDRYRIEQSRMAIVGYADTLAMDTNTTDAGRARNRRVDITVLSEESSAKDAVSPASSRKGT